MAYKFFDRVKETTSVTGAIDALLMGAPTGYKKFSDVLSNGDTFDYCIAHKINNEWEVGIGTYVLATNSIARTTIKASTNAGLIVSFSSGAKDVFICFPAYHAAGVHVVNASGDVSISSVTPATSPTSGALVVSGGIASGDSTHAAGKVVALSGIANIALEYDTQTTSRVMGAGNVFSGGQVLRCDVIGHDNIITRQAGSSALIIGVGITANAHSNMVSVGKGNTHGGGANSNSTFLGTIPNGNFNASESVQIGQSCAVSTNAGSHVGIGRSASIGAQSVVAIGRSATANSTGAIALGRGTSVGTSANAVAVGFNVAISGSASGIAIGGGASATTAASATAAYGVAMGGGSTTGARASGANSVAIGGYGSGNGASATGASAIAIGPATTSTHVDSVVIGRGAASAKDNQIVLGNATNHTEVSIPATTASSSPTTGALVVAGGAGFGGNVSQGISTYHYFGSENVDGSWRDYISGTDRVTEKRESGVWVEKARVSA